MANALARRAGKEWTPPDAGKIKELWTKCVDDMLDVRRSFWLNDAFFAGQQWVTWNDSREQVDILDFSDADEARQRATMNKIKPRVNQFVARLARTPLTFEPAPKGVDATALRRARLEKQVLTVKAQRDDWEFVRAEELRFATLGGVAGVCLEPDWHYGEEAVVDPFTGEELHLPEKPRIILTALSPVEFGIEPGTRHTRDARWWIKCTTLTPEQAQERYGLDEAPKPDTDSAAPPMHRRLAGERRVSNIARTCLVYVYYERPCGRSPGCVIHVVGGKVVQQGEWPFPFKDRLNLRTFVQTPRNGSWKGDTICNDARQPQLVINRIYTSINAHIDKADNARLLLPIGAGIEDDDVSGEAGEIIRYDPAGGGMPQWMRPPELSRWQREQIGAAEAELDDLFSAHSVSRGIAPGDRNSGTALAILAEKDETPLGLMVTDQQRGWQDIATMVLRTERHLLEIADREMAAMGLQSRMEVSEVLEQGDGPEQQAIEVKYRAEDLSKDPLVHVPLDAVMPRSQVAVQDMMLRLAQQFPQLFATLNPQALAATLQVPDARAFAQVADWQLALAEWENGRMLAGADDSEVVIAEWHDHGKHIEQHNASRASSSYRDAPPEVQQYMDMHVQAHEQLQEQLAMEAAAKQAQLAMMQQPQMSLPPGGMPPGEGPMAQEGPMMPDDQGVPA